MNCPRAVHDVRSGRHNASLHNASRPVTGSGLRAVAEVGDYTDDPLANATDIGLGLQLIA